MTLMGDSSYKLERKGYINVLEEEISFRNNNNKLFNLHARKDH
jgi:hypothetical protein